MKQNALKIFSMEGKVIIITGGAGFLGMQYARALGKAGATVVLWDKSNTNKLCEYHQVWQVDITDEKIVKRSIELVLKTYGRIDVLINNAALNPSVGSEESKQMFASYEEYPIDLFRKEMDVNVTGMHICIQAVAPHMMKGHKGVIVNVASEYANIAADNRIYDEGKFKSIAYITAKTGVLGLTRGWASYLGKYGIRVNTFTPGGMPHPGTPEEFKEKYSNLNMLGRMAEIDEYNGAILFLCSDASSFMTGAQLIMDGGKSAW